MTRAEVAELARQFWELAGQTDYYPRNLELSVAWALPLAIVKLPRLSIVGLVTWLEGRGIGVPLNINERPLRACLVARNGRGLVFLDGTDQTDEQRFSLAHEAAHFLLDYLAPRNKATTKLGKSVEQIFDGFRPANIGERLSAILSGIDLQPYTHLMERSESGDFLTGDVLEREVRSSRMALELLAPIDVATVKIEEGIDTWQGEFAIQQAEAVLRTHFGIPVLPAREYARLLVVQRRSQMSFQEWLGDREAVSNFPPVAGIEE